MRFILFCLLTLSFIFVKGQNKDSTKHARDFTDNYYSPFHRAINDSTKRTVSTFGYYGSIGYGGGRVNGLADYSLQLCYSLAYKSHFFSLTHGEVSHYVKLPTHEQHYYTVYNGLLFGESIRFKYGMVSLSTGIAYSVVNYIYRDN